MSGDLETQMSELRAAWLELAYLVLETAGVIRLAERLGLTLRPWVREQRERACSR